MRGLCSFVLVLAVLPGCVQVPPSLPDAAVAETPALPDLAMDAFLEDYEAFVRTYPDRAANGPQHEGARQHMAQVFGESGLQVWRHEFTDGIPQVNVVGIQWGVQRDVWVILAGHYDTFSDDCIFLPEPCPGRKATGGAYDDGSGTAMTLHMARLFAPLQPAYTVAYVAFDGEERGLQGSRALAADIAEGRTPFGDVALRAVIDVDMFGLNWPGVSTPVHFEHNHPALLGAVEDARSELGVPDHMFVTGTASSEGGSDYAAFAGDWPTAYFMSNMGSQGLPATPAGDTPSVPGYYPFWHHGDTWETLLASAGGPENLRAGFEVANGLVARLLLATAFDPGFEVEPL